MMVGEETEEYHLGLFNSSSSDSHCRIPAVTYGNQFVVVVVLCAPFTTRASVRE